MNTNGNYHLEDGQIESKGKYKDGEEEGLWVSYYYNGELWDKGKYKNGVRDGEWVSYNTDGTLEYKKTF